MSDDPTRYPHVLSVRVDDYLREQVRIRLYLVGDERTALYSDAMRAVLTGYLGVMRTLRAEVMLDEAAAEALLATDDMADLVAAGYSTAQAMALWDGIAVCRFAHRGGSPLTLFDLGVQKEGL